MNTITRIVGLGFACVLWFVSPGSRMEAKDSGAPSNTEKPGAVERAALARMGFVVGEWEGEGWSLDRSGQRQRFWAKESYRYRGDKDLLDMEGRFGGILADGTRAAEQEYALGILYFDRESQSYMMWHYSDDGTLFTVKMNVDIAQRSAYYLKTRAGGESGKFSLSIGEDGIWTAGLEILRPDNTWLKVMEFRMKRRPTEPQVQQ